jgi:phenylalanyl-tRNA synthetase alpha chain
MELTLSESEYNLLRRLAGRVKVGRKYSSEEIAKLVSLPKSSVEAIAALLAEKGVVRVERERRRVVEVNELGRLYLERGFPEERLAALLKSHGGVLAMDDAKKLLGDEASIAVAHALRHGAIKVVSGLIQLVKADYVSPDRNLLEKVARGETVSETDIVRLKRRKLVTVREETLTFIEFLEDPKIVLSKAVVEVGALTADIIRSGEWRRFKLRRYDVTANPPQLAVNKLNAFVEFIEWLRDIMKELGFTEVEYPVVELEFWNYDILFQPQYHPARAPTDTFYVKAERHPEAGRIYELADSVAKIHELAWRYKWDLRIALRLILRSHTTAATIRALAYRPRPPFRIFTIGRVYRVEKIDPKHLPEFHQLDGIASDGYDTSFRDLLGLLAELFERMGIHEYKFRLAYFPFTEPSAEGYVRIRGEWIEVLGCGLFRPEVLKPLGVDYPVAAWGIGLERIAMALLGVNDIRDLYALDIHRAKRIRAPVVVHASSQV